MSLEVDRNVDGDRALLVDSEEVHVEADVLDRVELELVENCSIFLAVVKVDVYDIGSRNVGESLELFCRYCEEDVLHAESVKVAWYETFFAESFDRGLVSDRADLAVQFEMFHCVCLFKMCYSVLRPEDPIAPKALWLCFGNAGAKILSFCQLSNTFGISI